MSASGWSMDVMRHGGEGTTAPRLDLAFVGAGVAGLGAAWLLSKRHRVTLYERNSYAGGHSNTVDVMHDGAATAVDTGFIVYNEKNYPNLTALFQHLRVTTQTSNMSFAVSLAGGRFEYCGDGFTGIFAQKRNLVSPAMWRMVADVIRFYRNAQAAGSSNEGLTIGEFLDAKGYSSAFVNRHLMPMIAAIWSVPPRAAADFPLSTILKFFENHGLLELKQRAAWRTVSGGSRGYVQGLLAGMGCPIELSSPIDKIVRTTDGVVLRDRQGGLHSHDGVVVATHADEALRLLAMPTAQETRVLGAFRYQLNRAVLHSDPRLMPRRRRIWSSWNVMGTEDPARPIGVTYWMNRLQSLNTELPLFVSLNPPVEPRTSLTHKAIHYDHPILDASATRAQSELDGLQGAGNVWFCGSYFGYGFHEDALRSGLNVAERLGVRRPWGGGGREGIADPDEGQVAQRAAGGQRG